VRAVDGGVVVKVLDVSKDFVFHRRLPCQCGYILQQNDNFASKSYHFVVCVHAAGCPLGGSPRLNLRERPHSVAWVFSALPPAP
jgi:hypothetical protein